MLGEQLVLGVPLLRELTGSLAELPFQMTNLARQLLLAAELRLGALFVLIFQLLNLLQVLGGQVSLGRGPHLLRQLLREALGHLLSDLIADAPRHLLRHLQSGLFDCNLPCILDHNLPQVILSRDLFVHFQSWHT